MSRRIAVLVLCALALPVSTAQAWTWPVDGPVIRAFSFDHAHPYAAGQHRGVDLGAAMGTDVRAPFTGVASFTGTVPGGGMTVSIRTELGLTLTLVHLGSIAVARGAAVAEGDVVGTVGPSGTVESTEPFGAPTAQTSSGTTSPSGVVRPTATRSSSGRRSATGTFDRATGCRDSVSACRGADRPGHGGTCIDTGG